ncbi:hypothetical protein [Trichothermofontia sp.]
MVDRSPAAIVSAITETLDQLEPLACYLPPVLLTHVVEHTANRRVPPNLRHRRSPLSAFGASQNKQISPLQRPCPP